jgi:saccharopine dehydrogenase-like NADP-dependent oxidoreductase
MNGPHTVFIAGAGGIGEAAAAILQAWSDFRVDLVLGDSDAARLHAACGRLEHRGVDGGTVRGVVMPLVGSSPELERALDGAEVLLDCLPGNQAPRLARLALQYGLHYANLTEYVAESAAISELARDAETGFILQTGLAPGFVNVLGKSLVDDFLATWDVDRIERLAMRVGALPQHAEGPHYYAFTWSTVGVATEYVKDAIVVRDHHKRTVPALSERETLFLGGEAYEADLTSGGAADLPDALHAQVRTLDYKTIRHPGHYAWVESILRAASPDERISHLQRAMETSIPSIEEDVVLVYASVEGFDPQGIRRGIQRSFRIHPMTVGGHRLRAIQTTTAAPLAECANMLLTGRYRGVVQQSHIDTREFLTGRYVSRVFRP